MPDWIGYVRLHLRPLRVPAEREAAIVSELAGQLEQAYAEALSAGLADAGARQRAAAQIGDWQRLADAIEEAETPQSPAEPAAGPLAGIAQDLRFALRFLRRNPAFAAIALTTLAFGIGGNTAVFTMVDALVLRDLPYRDPARLMTMETRRTDQPEIEPWTSLADFSDFRARQNSFVAMAAISPLWNLVQTGKGPAEQLDGLYVSAEFFPMVGVNAALGRTFTPEEDRAGSPGAVAVLSHSYWQRRFGARPDAIGQSLRLDGTVFSVVGVLPAGFRWAGEPVTGTNSEVQVWLPLAANQLAGSARSVRFLKVIARRRDGVTEAQAREDVQRISAALAVQYPEFDKGYASTVRPLAEQVTGKLRTPMMLLLGAVGFVLLMVCANVANLLLARAAGRGREIAVRVAVGAGAWRVMRQLLTEGVVLAALGGAAGVPLGFLMLRLLTAAAPDTVARQGAIQMDLRAVAFAAAAVLLCSILAGLPPAIRLVREHFATSLRESGRGAIAGPRRLASALVVAQVAAALTLLAGAGLLVRSFQRVLAVPTGFDPRNLVSIATQLPAGARTPDARRSLYERTRESLLRVPGVMSVAAVSRLPFSGRNLGTWVYVEGRDVPGSPGVEVEYRVATASYFETMGIRLVAGRLYDAHDDANPRAVIVVNRAMERRIWLGESAVGKRVKLNSAANTPWTQVIGVVEDVRHFGLESDPRPELYRPYLVNPLGAPVLVIRTGADAQAYLPVLSTAVRSVDPEMPAYNEFAMETLVARSTQQRRFVMLLLTGFALAATLLAGLGIYGTISQIVAQRIPEIGVRMALGASPSAVLAMVLRDGGRLIAAGSAAGALLASGMAWVMRGMLFGIAPWDPAAFAGAFALLTGIALGACAMPAVRAAKVDPVDALRAGG